MRHLLAAALGGLRQRFGLQHAAVKSRRAVGERCAVDVEGVVGGTGHAGPCASRQAVPSRAGVGRCLGQQAAIPANRAVAQQILEIGQQFLGSVILHQVLAQAVGSKKDDTVSFGRIGVIHRGCGKYGAGKQGKGDDKRQQAAQSSPEGGLFHTEPLPFM